MKKKLVKFETKKTVIEKGVVTIKTGAYASDVYDILGNTDYTSRYEGPTVVLEFVKRGD